jgi:hypothetical protein
MQDHRSHGRNSERPDSDVRKEATTDEQDKAIEFAVIALILSRHPAQLTLAELIREVADDPSQFPQVDAINCAVRDLCGVGLLSRNGEFLVPSQAALRMDSLTNAWSENE